MHIDTVFVEVVYAAETALLSAGLHVKAVTSTSSAVTVPSDGSMAVLSKFVPTTLSPVSVVNSNDTWTNRISVLDGKALVNLMQYSYVPTVSSMLVPCPVSWEYTFAFSRKACVNVVVAVVGDPEFVVEISVVKAVVQSFSKVDAVGVPVACVATILMTSLAYDALSYVS